MTQPTTRPSIDRSRCQGHGQCAMMAPDVFDLDAEGYGTVLVEEVADDLRRDAETAVSACPEQAISLDG